MREVAGGWGGGRAEREQYTLNFTCRFLFTTFILVKKTEQAYTHIYIYIQLDLNAHIINYSQTIKNLFVLHPVCCLLSVSQAHF